MFRWWAFWRRIQYGTAFLVVMLLIGWGIYVTKIYQAPTCLDGLMNGDEFGIDCGGSCKRICEADTIPPESLWTKAFRVQDGQYNVVSYVANKNKTVGTQLLSYTIQLFDAGGLITERTGSTVMPPDGTYPIFEGRVMTGDRVPTETTIEFSHNVVWLPATVGREQFVLEQRELKNADSKPRLTARLKNTSLSEVKNVEVVALVFDTAKHPLTVARTVVEYFGGRTTHDLVFTWPEPISKTIRSCEVPTDVMLAVDLSGSMNNDGGTPPEPIGSVLRAAKSFANELNKNDRVGLVTYATGAALVQTLLADSLRAGDAIEKLTIDPKEERGSTNIGEALTRMREEFATVRHNEDARKVAVLLTDGLATAPDPDPEGFARTEASALKAQGVELFTIGLGNELNEEFLTSIATDAKHYYKAPGTQDLTSIYTAITSALCEDGAAIIEIVAKPETSFVSGE